MYVSEGPYVYEPIYAYGAEQRFKPMKSTQPGLNQQITTEHKDSQHMAQLLCPVCSAEGGSKRERQMITYWTTARVYTHIDSRWPYKSVMYVTKY